jgi:hypothetical protein
MIRIGHSSCLDLLDVCDVLSILNNQPCNSAARPPGIYFRPFPCGENCSGSGSFLGCVVEGEGGRKVGGFLNACCPGALLTTGCEEGGATVMNLEADGGIARFIGG